MGRQAGLFDIEKRLGDLSAKGDDLERINALVDFEAFRPELERAVPRSDWVPDANSIWNFREALTRTTRDGLPTIEGVFRRFDAQLRAAGFIAMGMGLGRHALG